MNRGEVWWAELGGDSSFRPVVIVSRSEAIANRRTVTIAEVTRVVRRLPAEVPLSKADGMPADSVVNTDNLHTIPQDRFRARILNLNDEQRFALDNALRYSLDLG